jgi:crossover junction endodeoxyribonuclease RuvC
MIVGIDPGLDGGVAIITEAKGIVEVRPMPVIGTKGDGKRQIDGRALISMLKNGERDPEEISVCVVESVHAMKGQGVTSMFNFGMGYGRILGILETLRIPTELVTPQKWKKHVLAGTPKDKTAAISYCQTAYPKCELILKGCRVPHDGMADALCMAEYGRRMLYADKDNPFVGVS